MLSKQGYEVIIEHTTAGAEKTLSAGNIDVIILDLKVGDDDGYSLIELFPGLEDKFIVITGNIMEKETKKRFAGSKIPIVFKPFDFKEISDKVREKIYEKKEGE